jgi:ABC-type polysaccharide/polyol phosphate transport system ATPase subunit
MRENIFIVGSLFGLTHKEISSKFDKIVAFSELENFVDTKLYQFSAGMLQRLAFAIAINSNPEVLLLDEVFEVGDESFKKKSVSEISRLVINGACVIWVSHDLDMIKKYCNRVVWLKDGKVFKQGDPKKIVDLYLKNDTGYSK